MTAPPVACETDIEWPAYFLAEMGVSAVDPKGEDCVVSMSVWIADGAPRVPRRLGLPCAPKRPHGVRRGLTRGQAAQTGKGCGCAIGPEGGILATSRALRNIVRSSCAAACWSCIFPAPIDLRTCGMRRCGRLQSLTATGALQSGGWFGRRTGGGRASRWRSRRGASPRRGGAAATRHRVSDPAGPSKQVCATHMHPVR